MYDELYADLPIESRLRITMAAHRRRLHYRILNVSAVALMLVMLAGAVGARYLTSETDRFAAQIVE